MATEQEGHTQGPWTVRMSGDGDYLNIDAWHGEPSSDWLGHSQCWFNDNRATHETEANARLIAAAPDLLKDGAFLADRLDELENDLLDDEAARQFYGHVAPALARFRAAIARATGEA